MKLLAVGIFSLAAIALTGCSASAETTATPAPAPTVTVTATVTAAATRAPRDDDAPIDAFDAWYFCSSQAYEFVANTSPSELPKNVNDYDAKFVGEEDGAFTVQLVGDLGDTAGDAVFCVVSGTLGEPTVDDYQYPQ